MSPAGGNVRRSRPPTGPRTGRRPFACAKRRAPACRPPHPAGFQRAPGRAWPGSGWGGVRRARRQAVSLAERAATHCRSLRGCGTRAAPGGFPDSRGEEAPAGQSTGTAPPRPRQQGSVREGARAAAV